MLFDLKPFDRKRRQVKIIPLAGLHSRTGLAVYDGYVVAVLPYHLLHFNFHEYSYC